MTNDSLGHRASKAAGSTFAVFWFAALFIATIATATITLTASQLQSRLLTVSSSETPVSVWQIERIRDQWELQQRNIDQQAEKVAKLRLSWNSAQTEMQELNDRRDALIARFEKVRDDLVSKIAIHDPQFPPGDLRQMSLPDFKLLVQKKVVQLGPGLAEPPKKLLEELVTTFNMSLQEVNEGIEHAESARRKTDAERDALGVEEKISETMQKRFELIVSQNGTLNPAEAQKINDLITEFAFMETFAGGALHKFSIVPNEFLIIILVVTMGILGSTLQLTYQYYRDDGLSQPSMLFLRPMLGAITAIVVFVLLKAGVLVVTDSAKLGEVAPLNPFFISFVGIVSGLMSENALQTIRRVGESWFSNAGSDPHARWAVGVQSLLTENKTIASLAANTGIDAADLEKWINEDEPVPSGMQQLISAWLGRDVRTLFTDIPPAKSGQSN